MLFSVEIGCAKMSNLEFGCVCKGDLPNSRLKARKSGGCRSGLDGEEREEGFGGVADWVDGKGVRRDGREKKDISGIADQFEKKSLRRDGKEKKKERKKERLSEPARVGGRGLGEREEDDEDEDDGDEDSGQEASKYAECLKYLFGCKVYTDILLTK